jgi:ribonuclease HI
MLIEIFTDGSATTKDKPGGYGWVIVIDGREYLFGSGSIPNATNNDAELEAAIQGLAHALKLIQVRPEVWMHVDVKSVVLVSDSEIILHWASGKYRFKQQAKIHKYEQLRSLMSRLQATTRWVEGHAGHEFNEKCDRLAGAERDKAMGKEPRKKSTKSTLMLQTIKEIAKVASTHDTGKREHGMPDWDYVAKQCEKVLNK